MTSDMKKCSYVGRPLATTSQTNHNLSSYEPSIRCYSSLPPLKTLAIISIAIILITIQSVGARKHHLVLTNDDRKYITISTFGYFIGGHLTLEVNKFSDNPHNDNSVFGFTLAKTMSDSLTPYLEGHEDRCLLMDDVVTINNDENIGLVSMVFDLKNNVVNLKCNKLLSKLRLSDGVALRPKRSDNATKVEDSPPVVAKPNAKQTNEIINDDYKPHIEAQNEINQEPSVVRKKQEPIDSHSVDNNSGSNTNADKLSKNNDIKPKDVQKVVANTNEKSVNLDEKISSNDLNSENELKSDDTVDSLKESHKSGSSESKSCVIETIKLHRTGDQKNPEFSFKIQALIAEDAHEGLYSLFFHNCPNYGSRGGFRKTTTFNLNLSISEDNFGNYLSAGEIPLPQLYFALSVIFFILGVIWLNVIRNKQNDAFKLHYLMAGLVFVKAFSLLFHGINYHFISTEGSQVETWAVLYYITHLLKGALLFITIVLIGTGWAFIKHILSDKDKKIFMIVIPLQVLANIADIITEESEEGELKHNMWREIFILVDLLCCGAILFPVVWSIRHLQEASQTDGKAAINLQKLKLFRHFYVMVVCYIYFTRIIVYLLKITVPFQYEWLNVFFQHSATLAFFLLTGYHFQPTSTNPYFQLTQSDDDLEMEEVLFVQPNSDAKKRPHRDIEANVNSSDTDRLITKRESSHDFD